MVPESFVHVTSTNLSNHELFIQCTCTIFNLIQRAAKHAINLSPKEEIVPNENMMCMHCYFYHGHLINVYGKVTQINIDTTTLSRPLQKVHESLQFINDPVQLARNVIYIGTTKFTIVGNDSYSVVNLTFLNGQCFAKCTQGMCGANLKNTRNIDKRDKDNEHISLCSHLNALYWNFELVKNFFPHFFNINEDENPEEDKSM